MSMSIRVSRTDRLRAYCSTISRGTTASLFKLLQFQVDLFNEIVLATMLPTVYLYLPKKSKFSLNDIHWIVLLCFVCVQSRLQNIRYYPFIVVPGCSDKSQ